MITAFLFIALATIILHSHIHQLFTDGRQILQEFSTDLVAERHRTVTTDFCFVNTKIDRDYTEIPVKATMTRGQIFGHQRCAVSIQVTLLKDTQPHRTVCLFKDSDPEVLTMDSLVTIGDAPIDKGDLYTWTEAVVGFVVNEPSSHVTGYIIKRHFYGTIRMYDKYRLYNIVFYIEPNDSLLLYGPQEPFKYVDGNAMLFEYLSSVPQLEWIPCKPVKVPTSTTKGTTPPAVPPPVIENLPAIIPPEIPEKTEAPSNVKPNKLPTKTTELTTKATQDPADNGDGTTKWAPNRTMRPPIIKDPSASAGPVVFPAPGFDKPMNTSFTDAQNNTNITSATSPTLSNATLQTTIPTVVAHSTVYANLTTINSSNLTNAAATNTTMNSANASTVTSDFKFSTDPDEIVSPTPVSSDLELNTPNNIHFPSSTDRDEGLGSRLPIVFSTDVPMKLSTDSDQSNSFHIPEDHTLINWIALTEASSLQLSPHKPVGEHMGPVELGTPNPDHSQMFSTEGLFRQTTAPPMITSTDKDQNPPTTSIAGETGGGDQTTKGKCKTEGCDGSKPEDGDDSTAYTSTDSARKSTQGNDGATNKDENSREYDGGNQPETETGKPPETEDGKPTESGEEIDSTKYASSDASGMKVTPTTQSVSLTVKPGLVPGGTSLPMIPTNRPEGNLTSLAPSKTNVPPAGGTSENPNQPLLPPNFIGSTERLAPTTVLYWSTEVPRPGEVAVPPPSAHVSKQPPGHVTEQPPGHVSEQPSEPERLPGFTGVLPANFVSSTEIAQSAFTTDMIHSTIVLPKFNQSARGLGYRRKRGKVLDVETAEVEKLDEREEIYENSPVDLYSDQAFPPGGAEEPFRRKKRNAHRQFFTENIIGEHDMVEEVNFLHGTTSTKVFDLRRDGAMICELCIWIQPNFADKFGLGGGLLRGVAEVVDIIKLLNWTFRTIDFNQDGFPENIGFKIKRILVSDKISQDLFTSSKRKRRSSRNYNYEIGDNIEQLLNRVHNIDASDLDLRPRRNELEVEVDEYYDNEFNEYPRIKSPPKLTEFSKDIEKVSAKQILRMLQGELSQKFHQCCAIFGFIYHDMAPVFSVSNKRALCSDKNVAIVSGYLEGRKIGKYDVLRGIMHSLGHLLGASHDDPTDADCAQSEYSNFINPFPLHAIQQLNVGLRPNSLRYSSCAKERMTMLLSSNGANCLKNVKKPFCGNGILDNYEECDCGSPWQCHSSYFCCGERDTLFACRPLQPNKFRCRTTRVW